MLCFWLAKDYKEPEHGKQEEKTNSLSFETISPDIISLQENLEHLQINQNQLIALAMLIGTDYNIGGIKGIGKECHQACKKHGNDFETLFNETKWNDFDFEWKEVFDLIGNMPVNRDYKLEWGKIDEDKIKKVLMEHDSQKKESIYILAS